MDDHALMGIYADTLFTYDTRGRMLLTNEPCAVARRPAPRLFLGCTPAGRVVRIGATVPDDLARQLEEIIKRHPPTASLHAPAAALSAVREALSQHAPLTQEESGPAYHFPPSITPPGEAIRLTEANVAVARQTYPWLLEELADWGPCFAVMHNGTAVSVCFSSRIGTDAEAAGVETLPAFRGRGYAAAVTAAWGAAVRERGRIPIYSTMWENLASQGVARRLGLILFGAETTWA
jgi:hypothetical protein